MLKGFSRLMFQSKFTLSASGLLLAGVTLGALGGCASNLCDTEPDSPNCEQIVPPDQLSLSVTPLRLSLSQGGMLNVKLGGRPPAGTRAFLRRAQSADLLLGTLEKSEQTLAIGAAELTGRTPGLAQIIVTQPDQTEMTAPLRLFVEPSFRNAAREYDTKQDGNAPIWTGIGDNGGVYTINSFAPFAGSPDRQLRIVDYQYNNSMLAPKSPQSFGAYRGYPISDQLPGRGALIADQVVAVSKNPVSLMYPVLTDLCGIKSQTCRQLNPMTLEFQKVMGLAADRRGLLVAVQTDAQVLAYRGSEATPFGEALTLTGMGSNKGSTVAVAVGDLDGDGQPDLVTLHQGPMGVSVFLRGSDSKLLRYSEPYSMQLQTAMGGVLPTAVAIADLDGDGLDDVALALGSTVTLLLNQGEGGFAAAEPISTSMTMAIDAIALGNIDPATGNHSTDVAVSSSTSQRVAVLLNQAAY